MLKKNIYIFFVYIYIKKYIYILYYTYLKIYAT